MLFLLEYIVTLPILLSLIGAGIIFEYRESNFSIFCILSAGLVGYFLYDPTLLTVLYLSIAYLVVGVVWSFWRYKRYVEQTVAKWNEEAATKGSNYAGDKSYMLSRLTPSNLTSTIVSWIIVWPFSMVESLTADIFHFIHTLVTKTFKSVYNKIYQSAIKDLVVVEKK